MTDRLTPEHIQSFLSRFRESTDARRFLQEAGLIDDNGCLTRPYQPCTSNHMDHLITPPSELIREWWEGTHGAFYEVEAITIQAARWGADQELEACCEWLNDDVGEPYASDLRAARRPKPPSLADQGLAILNTTVGCALDDAQLEVLQCALERLKQLDP